MGLRGVAEEVYHFFVVQFCELDAYFKVGGWGRVDCFLLDLGVEVCDAAGEDSLGRVVWG